MEMERPRAKWVGPSPGPGPGPGPTAATRQLLLCDRTDTLLQISGNKVRYLVNQEMSVQESIVKLLYQF